MISILLMTVFSETDPMVFNQGTTTTDFARVGPMDALASVSNKVGDVDKRAEIAQTYIDRLKGTATAEKTDVTVQKAGLKFKISAFAAKGTGAVMKFVKEGFTTVLSCFINLESVGRTAENVNDASKVDASWLSYFWNLWSGKDETFEKADFTPATQQRITEFDRSTDNGWPEFKGMIPRTWTAGQKDKQTEAGKAARLVEARQYISTLLRIPDAANFIRSFNKKIEEMLADLEKTKPDITQEYNNDENNPLDTSSEGHKLNKDWFKEIWNETFVPIAAKQLAADAADAADNLVQDALTKMETIAERYK